jgi:hypothetical protein
MEKKIQGGRSFGIWSVKRLNLKTGEKVENWAQSKCPSEKSTIKMENHPHIGFKYPVGNSEETIVCAFSMPFEWANSQAEWMGFKSRGSVLKKRLKNAQNGKKNRPHLLYRKEL